MPALVYLCLPRFQGWIPISENPEFWSEVHHLLLDRVYDRAGYAFAIDYNGEPLPPADPTTGEWIDALLRENQLPSK